MLESLIQAGAGKDRPVVFDFDNTIVCGDIGEAVLAMLVRDGQLTVASAAKVWSPALVPSEGHPIDLGSVRDLTEYYEALLAPTTHGGKDPMPLANGYAWAVEIMRDLSLLEVVRATQKVWALSQPMQERHLEVTPGHTSYPVPFFYPAIVEFMAELLRAQFEVWIVSASNVWSVRWLVLNGLNPLIKAHGIHKGLPASQVIGVSTLLADPAGRLYKDAVLVRENEAYAQLDETVSSSFRLTGLLQFPVPTYSGKVGVIWDAIKGRPWLCAGDSPGDHAMLSFSENRLWIARLEKPGYQEATQELIRQTGTNGWLIQPVFSRNHPQFVSDLKAIDQWMPEPPPHIRTAVEYLKSLSA